MSILRVNRSKRKHCVLHNGMITWNSLPDIFKVNVSFSMFKSKLSMLSMFFDKNMMYKIHFATIIKRVQNGKQGNITKEELHTFIGIHLVMGYNKLPTYRSYWMTQDNMGVSPIQQSMTRDNFELILGCLHLKTILKWTLNSKKSFTKLDPWHNLWMKTSRNIDHRLNTCVDESMIRFKGRSSLKQYNPMKPIKRGYKIWCLADNDGYIYKFDIYTVKSQDFNKEEHHQLLSRDDGWNIQFHLLHD